MTASLVETTRKRQLESKEAPGLSRRSSYVSHIRLENIRGFGPKFDLNLSSEEDGTRGVGHSLSVRMALARPHCCAASLSACAGERMRTLFLQSRSDP